MTYFSYFLTLWRIFILKIFVFTCMALLHLPLDLRTKIQIYTSYILHTCFYRYMQPTPPPPPPSLKVILNSTDVQAHNRPNHISSPPLPTSSILFCAFQFYYVLLQYIFLDFPNRTHILHAFWFRDVVFMSMSYFLCFLPSWFLASCRIYFLMSWHTFNTVWCHVVLMTYFPYFLNSWHQHHDYFLTSWCTVWPHVCHTFHFMTFWCTFNTFNVIMYFWLQGTCHDILFDAT